VRRPHGGGAAPAVGRAAAILGGIAWLVLVPASELQRRELLSYDGYNRMLAVPLLLFLVALLLVPRALAVRRPVPRAGFRTAAAGTGLLLAGNLLEFYGVLLQDAPNAYAAAQTGATGHWLGSDIGWIVFSLGMFVLLAGGVVAATGLWRQHAWPPWLVAFTAALGAGVLAGNLFALESVFLSAAVLTPYATGWIAFGVHARRGRLPQGDVAAQVP
jgi:hypothetical protein